ncbi:MULTISPECIES: UPF0175 family protein [Methylobacterium]|jgi:hypothetical protein|uniref:Uncharacterized protein n=1 Tax=Methylobacterium brachiatum TaxID=269660 RepID=A0AAJ1U014_9HYPH|nr:MULTISPECIES: UPF0175 family protein [Methylobacterium]EIZ84334.1 hypothetical protein WYO_3215 [Methylobacterium sp. GXF4]MBP32512.1 hypothetical protein [Methylobacterium sp.]MDH2312527.1 UPF0175 family protein [Methylobacterium brachiatum]MDQ0546797.1 hypothetical protein [Methylobacterium brachiatum]
MNLSVPIPDDLAERLRAGGADIERRALEAFAAEEYRAGRLTHPELRRMLGFSTHAALDAFLKARSIYEPYGIADFERERADLARLGL